MSEQQNTTQEDRTPDVYNRIVKNLREILSTTGNITKTEFDKALKRAGTSVDEASQYTRAEINKAKESVRKDWQSFVNVANSRKTEFIESERFQRIADTSLGALGKLTKSIKDWATFLDEKIENQITYRTGEVAGAGTFKCTECGKTITMSKSGRIPPCSSCKNTSFQRQF